ncbi:MAG: peptide ABC transporter substrate-binding protein [Eubacteriales bacterium]|nr:peptide ABC transporter substrate-binding protein [Eubacteriales bacterium]
MKKRLFSILLTAAVAMSVTPCAVSAEEEEKDKEQVYYTYLATDPSTLDSIKGNDQYSWSILTNIMEPLTRLEEEDGKQVRKPAGAESWESNEDGTVWTFKIRDNKWSDGEPVTAQDYAYGITQTLNPEAGSPNSFFIECVKNAGAVLSGELPVEELGVKAVDDKTLEITLENPTPYFMSLTDTRAMYPVRQDIAEQYGETYGAEAENIVGNGPFKLEYWTHNSEIKVVKNEDYWDAENVSLTDVTWAILSDETAVYNNFDSGMLDYCSTGTQEWMDRFDKKDGVERVDAAIPEMRFDFFNTEDELFGNLNIRKAFTLAVDREDMAKVIYQNAHEPAYYWIPKAVSTGELGQYRDQVGEPVKDMASEDPKELLLKGMEELGLGDDPSTLDVTYTLSATTQWARNYAEYCQQKIKEVLGVELKLDFNEWSSFQQKTNNGEYQMANMLWSTDYDDPMSMMGLFTTGNMSIPTFWSNEEFDSLIEQASTEMDEQKRVDLYYQAEKILFEEGCVICPLVNDQWHKFNYTYVKGLSKFYTSTSGLKNVYISGR